MTEKERKRIVRLMKRMQVSLRRMGTTMEEASIACNLLAKTAGSIARALGGTKSEKGGSNKR